MPAGGTLLVTLGGPDAVAAIVDAALQRATADWRVKRFLPDAGACDPAARKHMVGGWVVLVCGGQRGCGVDKGQQTQPAASMPLPLCLPAGGLAGSGVWWRPVQRPRPRGLRCREGHGRLAHQRARCARDGRHERAGHAFGTVVSTAPCLVADALGAGRSRTHAWPSPFVQECIEAAAAEMAAARKRGGLP